MDNETLILDLRLKIREQDKEIKRLKKELSYAAVRLEQAESKGYEHGHRVGESDGRRLAIDELRNLLRINENS